MVRGSSGILPYQTKKIILSHLIENLADSQEQYQMAFIKCQYTDDYLLTVILPYVSLKVHTAFIFSLNNRKNHQFYLKSAKNSFNKYTTI